MQVFYLFIQRLRLYGGKISVGVKIISSIFPYNHLILFFPLLFLLQSLEHMYLFLHFHSLKFHNP